MLKNIFDRYWKTLPQSPTSTSINWIATFIFIYSLTIIKEYNIPEMEAAVFSMIALALPIIILEFIFLKTYNRPSTGLNFKLHNATHSSRITVKIVGLYGTIGFVALIYWLFPIYRSGFYDNYWIFIKYIALILMIGGIPYFIILDKYLVEPRDSYWHFGMLILGQWKKSDSKIVKQHILGWLVKLFFLPLMFSFLINNINFIKGSDFSEVMNYFPNLFNHLQNLIFTVDLAFVSVGYLMTMKIFDSQIRTAEPTILGWLVALQCYQPFWDFSNNNYLQYDDDIVWGNLFVYPEFLYYFWGASILILLLIYVWASITFGIRFSNLTNRGILTNGPYRFCMHPAYISKNLSWWLVSLPFLSHAGHWEAIRHSILLLCVNIIYLIRAITEERHLSQDPNYVKYGLAMNNLSIFRGLFGIFPILKYNPQKYLSQLEDYSGFTVPKSVPLQ